MNELWSLIIKIFIVITIIDIIVFFYKKRESNKTIKFIILTTLIGGIWLNSALRKDNNQIKTVKIGTANNIPNPYYNHVIKPGTEILQDQIKQMGIDLMQRNNKSGVSGKGIEAVEMARMEVRDFKAQYAKPKECFNITDDSTRMFCANHFIRSRKEFDRKRIAIN